MDHGNVIDDLRMQIVTLTRERDLANTRVEELEDENLAAQQLLTEVEDGATAELKARVADLRVQLNELQAASAAEEQRKDALQQSARNTQRAVDAIRDTLKELAAQQNAAERNLRETTAQVGDAKRALVTTEEETQAVRDEMAALRRMLERFEPQEAEPCGCVFWLQKGRNCVPGAMMTVITPCDMLGNTSPARHVTNYHQ